MAAEAIFPSVWQSSHLLRYAEGNFQAVAIALLIEAVAIALLIEAVAARFAH
jgi:hypothetical protein